MRRLFATIIIIVISMYAGAYIGKDKLNQYAENGSIKAIDFTKAGCGWIVNHWKDSK